MKTFGISMLALAVVVAGNLANSQANNPKGKPAPCEPGYQWVEVTEYQQVCRDVCKIVPDVKKTTKWVYSQIDDPFCIKKSPHGNGHQCSEGCPICQGPYSRKLLVKRQVVCEEPTTKCVVEKIVETVPCKVWKKVPCASPIPAGPHTPAAAAPEPIPAPK